MRNTEAHHRRVHRSTSRVMRIDIDRRNVEAVRIENFAVGGIVADRRERSVCPWNRIRCRVGTPGHEQMSRHSAAAVQRSGDPGVQHLGAGVLHRRPGNARPTRRQRADQRALLRAWSCDAAQRRAYGICIRPRAAIRRRPAPDPARPRQKACRQCRVQKRGRIQKACIAVHLRRPNRRWRNEIACVAVHTLRTCNQVYACPNCNIPVQRIVRIDRRKSTLTGRELGPRRERGGRRGCG